MKVKQFVYRYEGDPKTDEVVQDLEGDTPVPQKGAVIPRKGTTWTVVEVLTSHNPPAIPVYRVFLAKGASR